MTERRGWYSKAHRDRYEDPFRELGLDRGTSGLLFRGGVSSVEELTSKTPVDLFRIRGFGPSKLKKVQEKLEEKGLSLELEGATLKVWERRRFNT